MSELEDDKPLDPWMRAALLCEGLEGGPSPTQRERMAGKLAAAIGLPLAALLAPAALTAPAAVGAGAAGAGAGGAGAGAGAAGAGAAGGAGAGAAGASAGAAGSAHAGAAGAAGGVAASKSIAAIVTGALVAGGAIGVTVSELRPRDQAPAVQPPTTVEPTNSAADGAPIDADLDEASSVDAGLAAAPSDARARPAARVDAAVDPVAADELARERELIDVARAALRRGDHRLATKSTVEHELRFPKGKLVEERRVIAIELAIAKGNRDEAARLATEFRRDYPRSVFAKRIDELVPP